MAALFTVSATVLIFCALWWLSGDAGLAWLNRRSGRLRGEGLPLASSQASASRTVVPDSDGDSKRPYSGLTTSNDQTTKTPRISRPVPLMRSEYDVVVVGSGYGGGVAASRMARTGKSVAVLELGLEKWRPLAGEYPSSLKDVAPEYQVTGTIGKQRTLGKPTGMYHTIKGDGQDVFLGHGLGGTSLINANVYLRADHRTLELEEWPEEIRKDPTSMDQYYARAEAMLQPMSYPDHYPSLKKLEVFEQQATALGQEHNFYRVPQTTFFRDDVNNAGVGLKASTCTGQDTTGINDGSKNSVLMNYLPDAWNRGAEIFCECEVRHIRKDPNGNGYLLYYAWHGDGREYSKDTFYDQLMWIRAKELCFLGAGALGTTEILLRSKARGLTMSPLVGQKISGNGDLLCFAYNTNETINGVGNEKPSVAGPCGPTITSIIDNRGSEAVPNIRNGYVIEEGAVPEALAPMIQTMIEVQPNQVYPKHYSRIKCLLNRIKTMVMGPYSKGCSTNRTQSYLVMSHDTNEGVLTLEDEQPRLQFLGDGEDKRTERLLGILRKATEAIGGVFVISPRITAHPLGGAIMSSDGTGAQGVVNASGQLFKGDGEDVYSGIVCVDGSVVPTSLCVNPFATITALAERSCDILLRENEWPVDETPNGKLDLFSKPAKAIPMSNYMEEMAHALSNGFEADGVRFFEVMEGHVHIGTDITDFIAAEKAANGAASAARLSISVDVPSVENLTGRASHMAFVTGTFSCGTLSQDPLLITKGRVHFFTADDEVSDGTNFIYTLSLLSTDGETYNLQGVKKLDSNMAFSGLRTWKATTTLYTILTRTDGTPVGRGILRISGRDFINELLTFGPGSSNTGWQKLLAPLYFLSFFARHTLNYVLSPLRPLEYPDTSKTGYLPKPLPTKSLVTASDGVQTVVNFWKPKPGTPHHSMALVFIPGASVDDQIFSLPTIPTNAVDYFTALGYRVYIPVLRFGRGGPAEDGWTSYDARLDVRAAVEYIREKEDGRRFYVVCHCLGSISTSMALLTGEIKQEWIQGMTCTQVFCNLRYSRDNATKARSPVLMKAYRALAGPWFPCTSSPTSPLVQYLLDQILRFYPIGPSRELCNSSVCHRCDLIFGRCWTHANLNHATHLHLGSFFSGIHMNFVEHLTHMGAVPPHHVRSNAPESVDLVAQKGNLERLRGLRICFLSGGSNVVWDPASTRESFEMCKERFPEGRFERVVVEGYGHLDTWMGKRSFKDVYPRVRAHVERCEGWNGVGVVEKEDGVRAEVGAGGDAKVEMERVGWLGGVKGALGMRR
ncbi:hypothetical protein BCR34DRAFT_348379 [Clohesyomyces aquaticus]|uniref:Cholesterol oxidase n=1 Tax=Clohesyomyces aquaticus TaxID=1231657 RepID=A0A1Y1ZJP0_9PLEO|nr:hypothetical protein BCR34DRAFT_348379 [Clohesyomyces aquaticus]